MFTYDNLFTLGVLDVDANVVESSRWRQPEWSEAPYTAVYYTEIDTQRTLKIDLRTRSKTNHFLHLICPHPNSYQNRNGGIINFQSILRNISNNYDLPIHPEKLKAIAGAKLYDTKSNI